MLHIIKPNQPAPIVETPFEFPLDPFQKHAVYAISKDENVLVTAKTGSGKTLVGEFQIWHSLKKGKRVFYTTPIKSLSNQKFHDLKRMYPSVGIMTGDIKYMPHADIVIMTTEILRNLLYKRDTETEFVGLTSSLSLDNVDAVIFDEVHYVNDPGRGKVWEECFVLLPPSINMVLLSATIEKPEPFAKWLGNIKQKPIHLISTEYRIVPLVHTLSNNKVLMDEKEMFYPSVYRDYLREYDLKEQELKKHKQEVRERDTEEPSIKRDVRDTSFVHEMNTLIKTLEQTQKLPALFFVLSRKLCMGYAKKVQTDLLTSSEAASVRQILNFHLHKYPDVCVSDQYFDLIGLLQKGIAFHHSGVLPILKEIVEILFARGFVKVLFATETFAVGLNMPTKTVVFTSFRKQSDSGEFRMLRPDEYTQMAGRAGRRGKDTKGIVIYLPRGRPESLQDMEAMMTGRKASITSKMQFHYSYVLQSLNSKKDLVTNSFWNSERLLEIQNLEKRLKQIQDSIPYLSEDEIRECLFRSSINDLPASKEKQIAQNKWLNSHMGPKWLDAWKYFLQKEKYAVEISKLETQIELFKQPPSEIEPRIETLKQYRFILDDTTKLSPLGVLATEINEANPILVAQAFHDKMFHSLSSQEIIVALSIFLEVKNEEEEEPSLHKCNISKECMESIMKLEQFAIQISKTECLKSEFGYWDIHTYWIDIIQQWLSDVPSKTLCRDYQIDEGTFVRNILKLSNLVDEWKNLATIMQDIDMLEKLVDIKIIREVVIPDSLYLRI